MYQLSLLLVTPQQYIFLALTTFFPFDLTCNLNHMCVCIKQVQCEGRSKPEVDLSSDDLLVGLSAGLSIEARMPRKVPFKLSKMTKLLKMRFLCEYRIYTVYICI